MTERKDRREYMWALIVVLGFVAFSIFWDFVPASYEINDAYPIHSQVRHYD